MKKVIGFIGLPASGKSTAVEAVNNLGIIIKVGDIVREETKKLGLEITPENLSKVSLDFHNDHGGKALAIKLVEKIKKLEENIVFIDGIRSKSEVKYIRKYWKFPIIAVLCDDKLRHKWILSRGRSDDSKNIEDVINRDKRELGYGLGKLLKKANYKIKNDSDIETLKEKTKIVIKKIIS